MTMKLRRLIKDLGIVGCVEILLGLVALVGGVFILSMAINPGQPHYQSDSLFTLPPTPVDSAPTENSLLLAGLGLAALVAGWAMLVEGFRPLRPGDSQPPPSPPTGESE